MGFDGRPAHRRPRSTLSRWLKQAGEDGRENIPTRSSKPKSCRHALDPAVVARTVELRKKHRRCYVYTLVDLKTRWAYAEVHARQDPLTPPLSLSEPESVSPHAFKMIQSDHGSEFAKTFEKLLKPMSRDSTGLSRKNVSGLIRITEPYAKT